MFKYGIANVTLSYSVNMGENINITMNKTDNLYTAKISPQPYNSTVTYLVYAYDKAGNVAVSAEYSYVVGDYRPPVISYIERVPASPNYNETVLVFANATEPSSASGVKEIILAYNNGTVWMNVTMSFQDGLYVATIPELPYGTVVQYRVYAVDNAGNWAVMDIYSYTVTDRFLPIARIDAPVYGSYLSGYVNVEAFVCDDNFYGAELTANGTILASWSEAGLHTCTWNTTATPDGAYSLKLEAYDEAGNIGETERLAIIDNTPPVFSNLEWSPSEPAVNEEVNVSVRVFEEGSGIGNVTLWFRTNTSGWECSSMTLQNGNWTCRIPGQAENATVEFYAECYDNAGNFAATLEKSYTVKATYVSGFPLHWLLLIIACVGAALTSAAYFFKFRKKKTKM